MYVLVRRSLWRGLAEHRVPMDHRSGASGGKVDRRRGASGGKLSAAAERTEVPSLGMCARHISNDSTHAHMTQRRNPGSAATDTHSHKQTHTGTHKDTRSQGHTHTHTRTQGVLVHTHAHTRTQGHKDTHTHTPTCTQTYPCMHVYIFCIHVCMYVWICIRFMYLGV